MEISIKQHVADLDIKIAQIEEMQETMRDEIAKVDPIRKQLLELENKKDSLVAAKRNLEHLIELTPEEQAALNPADPFGLD